MKFIVLEDIVAQQQLQKLSLKESQNCFYQMLNALIYLHTKNIIHWDVKLINIFVKTQNSLSIKLTDFNLTTNWNHSHSTCRTISYAVSEIYHEKPYINTVNMWSLDIFMLELSEGLSSLSLTDSEGLWTASKHSEWMALIYTQLEHVAFTDLRAQLSVNLQQVMRAMLDADSLRQSSAKKFFLLI